MVIRSKKVRDAARGQPCTVNIVGVCNGQSETTVLAHLPDQSHGVGLKAHDLSACFACDACHTVLDGRAKWPPMEEEHKDFYMRRAQTRTLVALYDMGILSIKGAA